MPKRDYKSYNILEEELAQEVADMEQNSQIPDMPAKEDVFEKNRKQMSYDDVNEVSLKVEQVKSENVDKKSPKIENEKYTESQQVEDSAKGQMQSEQEVKQEQVVVGKKDLKPAEEPPISHTRKEENSLDFPAYKRYYQQKERSRLFKGIMGLAKLIILIMLLPFIGIMAMGVLLAVGGIAMVVLGSIGTGIFILGTICFMATQLSMGLIALGISASATLISFGGIVSILFMMFAKWLMGLFNKYLKPRNMKKRESR